MEAEPKRETTASALASVIGSYCQDQRRARDVDDRWLSSYLEDTLRIVRQVQFSNLDPDMREKVNAFRLAEIAKEKQAKQREIDVLDREAKKLVCPA